MSDQTATSAPPPQAPAAGLEGVVGIGQRLAISDADVEPLQRERRGSPLEVRDHRRREVEGADLRPRLRGQERERGEPHVAHAHHQRAGGDAADAGAVAAPDGVSHQHGRGARHAQRNHVGERRQVDRHLMRRHLGGPEPAHEEGHDPEHAELELHLRADGGAESNHAGDRAPDEGVATDRKEILVELVPADGEERGRHERATERRGPRRAHRSHGGEAELAEDENPVEEDVGDVGRDDGEDEIQGDAPRRGRLAPRLGGHRRRLGLADGRAQDLGDLEARVVGRRRGLARLARVEGVLARRAAHEARALMA